MPPPVYQMPSKQYAGPVSSGLTQSHDDARQQRNRDMGYNPDALQRALDWIGRQFGSDRAARSPGPSAGSRVVDWIGRQFGSGPAKPQYPVDPSAEAWFQEVISPFGKVPYGPQKPVTKISSAPKIAKKIVGGMPGAGAQPGEDRAVAPQWPPPGAAGPGGGAMPGEDRAFAPQWPPPVVSPMDYSAMPGEDNPFMPQWPPPIPQPQTVDLSTLYPPDVNIFSQNPPRDPTWGERVSARGRVSPVPVRSAGPNTSSSPFSRAEGGPIPLMRGGYPELYGASRMPMRQMFDSGGESFVGSEYSSGSGREDDVNAKLSAKEYVIDAETMALLGDGNPDHGAAKMDQMRANIRKQKGAAFAKGKFSPKAKSAQEYLVGNPAGDGMRRKSRGKG